MRSTAEFRKLKTLIAEDDKLIRLVYEKGLSDEVFEKNFLIDGSSVLEAYSEWRPAIIILDIMLPGTSGYAILKAVREDFGDKATTIIMATSLSDRDAVLDCMKLGIQGYLVKPISHKDIADKVLGYFRSANPALADTAAARMEEARNRASESEQPGEAASGVEESGREAGQEQPSEPPEDSDPSPDGK